MRVTRTLILLTLLTLAIPVAVGAINASQAASTTAVALPIESADVQLAQTVNLSAAAQTDTTTQTDSNIAILGSIEAAETASLTFLTSGTISELFVNEGDYVEAGTLIARLDPENAQIAYDQAVYNLELAQLDLQELQEPPDEADLENARLSILSAQSAYTDAANSVSDTSLQSAQMRYEQAQASYDLAVQKRANMNASEQETALQDAAVGAASFNLEIARLQLQELQTPNSANLWSAGARIQIAQLEYDQLLVGPTDAELTNAQLAVSSAEARVADAQVTLQRLDLVAPYSGVITSLPVDVDANVTPSTEIAQLTDLSQLLLKAPLHELDLDQVGVGAPATIVLDALPDETFGASVQRIAWIGAESDGIVQYDIWLALDNADARVRLGMTGEANIDVSS
ncbi:MAG: HlyD family efflux transporter periplasmic adaptor subunit [Anaerolineae bacterium]|nr:HlyD family efflux transporter periplasmic adaptor subunit [Anaerolineae bacterium]